MWLLAQLRTQGLLGWFAKDMFKVSLAPGPVWAILEDHMDPVHAAQLQVLEIQLNACRFHAA